MKKVEYFKLPIFYLTNKNLLDNNIVNDLELIQAKDTPSLYKYVFNPTTSFGEDTLHLWAQYYTVDTKFLKDSQKLVKKYKNSVVFTSPGASETARQVWDELKLETGFKEKYYYIDWPWFEKLNSNALFLQGLSLYNMTSPIVSLALPILFLIIPFFILKLKGVPLTPASYCSLLKIVFSKHTLGQVFSGDLGSASINKKVYVAMSFAFYIFQIYQNILSCLRFYKNMKKIHNDLFVLRDYFEHTIKSMDNLLKFSDSLPTYTDFNNKVRHYKSILNTILSQLNTITPYRLSFKKAGQMGHIMKCFYDMYANSEYNEACMYSFGFNGYIDNIRGLKKNIKEKHIAACKFTKKKALFEEAYFPPLMDKNPVKNTYNINNQMLITGPNAAGKTTLLKTTLFNVLLSQQIGFGFYKKASLLPFHHIHCYINIPDTSGRDSLFQAEARRCKEILDLVNSHPKERHFCFFDELYSGTNPYEAISSAYSFLKYLNRYNNVNFIITTHFIDLCKRLDRDTNVTNYHMKIHDVNNTFNYTYQLETGISTIKGGVKVLADLEYPPEIIKNTQNMISKLII